MASEEEDSVFQEEENGSQEENENEYVVGKCGIIFLIDARLSMFLKDFVDTNNDEQTRFNIAIKCCRSVMMNKIIANQKDLVGVVLFRTDKGDPKTKHVTQLLELNYPNAEAVVKLDKLLNDSDSAELQRTYGTSEDFLLADALWYCSSLFSNSGANLVDKRILLFTDDDNPHASHSDKAHMARKRAEDLNKINISLELLPMGSDFDYSVFYKELVEIVNGKSDTEDVEPSCRLEEMMERVNRLDFKTRRYAKIKWDLGKGVCVGISLYTLYSETKVLAKESLNRATNEPVKRVVQTIDEATGELLLPSDIEEFVTIAGEDIVFTKEDKAALKKIMEPGMTLLGFKPLSFVSEAKHCQQSSFAYPEETLVKGSQTLVKALVERCIAKEKVPLCCFTPRIGAITKYVCLVPSAGDEIIPFGFHIIPLPSYNDERAQTFEPSPELDQRTLELAKTIINKLKFTYKPNNFKNPKLQMFWAHLEALALEYDAPDTVQDDTEVPVEAQSARLGGYSQLFVDVCGLPETDESKAKRSSTGNTSPTKRTKPSISPEKLRENIKAAIRTRKVETFTVVQLKDFLQYHNQRIGKYWKKVDLVDAVYNLQI